MINNVDALAKASDKLRARFTAVLRAHAFEGARGEGGAFPPTREEEVQ